MNTLLHHAKSRGYVLISVTVTLTVLAAISLMLNRDGAMTTAMSSESFHAVEAEAIAAAGLADLRFRTHRDDCSGYQDIVSEPFPVGSGNTYSATVNPKNGTPVRMTVTANTANGSTASVTVAKEVIYQYPAQTLFIQPTGSDINDTHLRRTHGHPHADNFNLEVLENPITADKRRALIQFDLEPLFSIDLDSRLHKLQILTAELAFHVNSITPGTSTVVEIFQVAREWHESTAEWDDGEPWLTEGGDFYPEPNISVAIPTEPMDVTVNVTGFVQHWVDYESDRDTSEPGTPDTTDDNSFGVIIIGTDDKKTHIKSGENEDSNSPSLSITYLCPCGVTCPP